MVKNTRKRKCNQSQWKKNISKLARNSGEKYKTSSKSNKEMKAREMLSPCKENCKLQCNTTINLESRKTIFENFWALGDIQRQREFLSSSMTPIMPKYRYPRHQSHRRNNNAFKFEIGGKAFRVCKKFFKSTLGISDRPIRTVLNKRNNVGIISCDLRGKHGQHVKLNSTIRDGVRRHIESIPRIESHYTRARSSREYIEGSKSIADLHRDYVEQCKSNNVPFAKYLIYYKMFNEEFNISFFTPKKDQCSLCASYSNASDDDKEKLKHEYDQHLIEKDLSRAEKQSDKEQLMHKHVIVAYFDLQAVLQCPKGEVSVFYYKSKLNTLNFTIYEMKQKKQADQCHCYVWDETQGQRGANEIGTCLLNYIEQKSKSNADEDNIELILYSDNCVGQQKNRYIISMYIYAVMKYKNIKSITHKFLIAGHTQNEGDSAHSVIERQIKRFLKSGPIFLPAQYVGIIRNAKKTGAPYLVKEMSYSDFVDLKLLNTKIGSWKNTEQKLTDVKIIKIERADPYKILYKTSYSAETFSEMTVKCPRGTAKLNQQLSLRHLYNKN